MPYVDCPKCSVRSFALAPWSTVAICPICDTPLTVRRQTVGAEEAISPRWSASGSPDDDATTSGALEAS